MTTPSTPWITIEAYCKAFRDWMGVRHGARRLDSSAGVLMQDGVIEAGLEHVAKAFDPERRAGVALLPDDICHVLIAWAGKVQEAAHAAEKRYRPSSGFASDSTAAHIAAEAYEVAIHEVMLAVEKSNLLARMIYGGEALRITKCPEHKGHWTGNGKCPHGCGLTGWLP